MPELQREAFVVVRELPSSVEAAWELLADFDFIPRWAPNVVSVETEPGPVGRGTIRRVQFTDYLLVERIEEWQPPAPRSAARPGPPPPGGSGHLAYAVIESPWPIADHRVDMLLCPLGEQVRAVAVGVFRAPADQAESLRRSFQVFLGQCLRNMGRLL